MWEVVEHKGKWVTQLAESGVHVTLAYSSEAVADSVCVALNGAEYVGIRMTTAILNSTTEDDAP